MIIVEEIAAVSLGLMKRSMSAFPLRKNKNILKGKIVFLKGKFFFP